MLSPQLHRKFTAVKLADTSRDAAQLADTLFVWFLYVRGITVNPHSKAFQNKNDVFLLMVSSLSQSDGWINTM